MVDIFANPVRVPQICLLVEVMPGIDHRAQYVLQDQAFHPMSCVTILLTQITMKVQCFDKTDVNLKIGLGTYHSQL